MKKVLSLILALIMCLPLSACGKDNPDANQGSTNNTIPNNTTAGTTPAQTKPEDTEDPVEEEKRERYTYVMDILSKEEENITQEELKEAYAILKELGVYEDTTKYLANFSVLHDIPKKTTYTTDRFGNVEDLSYGDWCTYNKDGKPIACGYEFGNNLYWEETLPPVYYNEEFKFYYTEEGKLNEVKIGELSWDGTSWEAKAVITPEFDDAGRLVTECYDSLEYGQLIIQYSYDAAGNKTKMESFWCNEKNQKRYSTEYQYDADGKLLQKDHYLYHGGVSYDGNYIQKHAEHTLTCYIYDDVGTLISATVTTQEYSVGVSSEIGAYQNLHKTQVTTISYCYDDSGKLVEEIWQYGDYVYADGHTEKHDIVSKTCSYNYDDVYFYTPSE